MKLLDRGYVIISIPHRFVFLAVPKCASTSIEAALQPYGSVSFVGPSEIKHIRLADYERYVAPLLATKRIDTASFEFFAVFREPVDWLRSWWRYRSRAELGEINHPDHKNYTGNISFDEFIREYMRPKPAAFARVGRQSRYLIKETGGFGPVTLYRYDEIDTFIADISDRIGRPVSLRETNRSPDRVSTVAVETISQLRALKPQDFKVYESISAGRTGIGCSVGARAAAGA